MPHLIINNSEFIVIQVKHFAKAFDFFHLDNDIKLINSEIQVTTV